MRICPLVFINLVLLFICGCSTTVHQSSYVPHLVHAHGNYVNDISVSPDGSLIASVSSDAKLKIFESASLKERTSVKSKWIGLNSVSFSPDAKVVAVSDIAGGIEFFDSANCQSIKRIKAHKNEVVSISYSPDGKYIASASKDGAIKVFSVADGKEIFCKACRINDSLPSFIIFSNDNKYLAASVGDTVIVISADSWQEFKRFHATGPDFPVQSMAFSPDGKTIAVGTHLNVRLWQILSGRLKRNISAHFGRIMSVAFSPDGKWLASGGGLQYFDSKIKIWDTNSGTQLSEIDMHEMPVSTLCFSPNSRFLYSGSWDEKIGMIDMGKVLLGKLSE